MKSAEELVELRVRTPMSIDELISMLKNIYRDQHKLELKPDAFDEYDGRLHVWTNPFFPFEGVVVKSDRKIETHEFERNYLRRTGWSVSSAIIGFSRKGIRLELETSGSPLESKPEFLYHAAPVEYVESILKRGLVPKTRPYDVSFRYLEPRVYFVTRLNFKLLKRLISDKSDVNDFVIFKLDTSKFKKFNLWPDDASDSSTLIYDNPFSVYTKTHIPSSALKITHRVTDGEVIKDPYYWL